MSGRIPRLPASAALVAVIWLAALLFWRVGGRTPSYLEALVLLAGLPLASLAAAWAWLQRHHARMRVTEPSPDSIGKGETKPMPNAENAMDADATPIWQPIALAAATVRTVRGNSSSEVRQALMPEAKMLELDTVLRDASGYPVPSGRMPSLDDCAECERLRTWMATRHPVQYWHDEDIRSLALMQQVIEELSGCLAAHPSLADLRANPVESSIQSTLPLCKLILLPGLSQPMQGAVQELAKDALTNAGWPSEKISITVDNENADAIEALNRVHATIHCGQASPIVMLVASSSCIGEATVRRLQVQNSLFCANNKQGSIPGEGAAGLLFSSPADATALAMPYSVVPGPFASATRDSSADMPGRSRPETAARVIMEAMQSFQAGIATVQHIFCDSDHRASRFAELVQAADDVLPDLDPAQCIRLEAACGTLGAASTIATIALAHDAVLTEQSAALCLFNRDAWKCAAIVVSAPVEATPHEADDTAAVSTSH